MLHKPVLIPPCVAFWPRAVRALLEAHPQDWSTVRVIVPTFFHARQLKLALAGEVPGAFIAPRINTLSGWLGLQAPLGKNSRVASQRLMTLYAELRQHGWLKNLFGASSSTDLLPLAQMLLGMCDELTEAMLPTIGLAPEATRQRWQAALEQLSPPARNMLSNEAQLVWSIWQSQLDEDLFSQDAVAGRFARLMQLAANAHEPLVWIDAVAPDAIEQAFLQAYARKQPVLQIMLDWHGSAVPAAYVQAWPELVEDMSLVQSGAAIDRVEVPSGLSLCAARSLEDEALQGAQTIINWLQSGKSCIAIIAQDRITARRLRALLERAQVLVTDETGWKLSTTRAAAALAAWFDVISSQAETIALLDLLKSPFVFAGLEDKAGWLMHIEAVLRQKNVLGGWEAVQNALADAPGERAWLRQIARQAAQFAGRKSLPEWIAVTHAALDALDMGTALSADAAGLQVLNMLAALQSDCTAGSTTFTFAEWRAFAGMQMEAITFIPPDVDRRVVMLPLNSARLRTFDAVLVVGCDAEHLPSQALETLFFANAVRRELGLATRESLQRQQLRDFTEVICSNPEVVLSWQAQKNGEPNPVSAWVERLQLALEQSQGRQQATDTSEQGALPLSALPFNQIRIESKTLAPKPVTMPAPSAPELLPATLSASGYNSFVACPYQFFATRMLHLSGLEELSDMPEKRDYGGWLHDILKTYHEAVRDNPAQERDSLLREISDRIFKQELDKNAAALGYYVRWQKVIPAYLEWAGAREQQGWQFVLGEAWLEKSLALEEGAITLHGRVDRIDENAAGERAVLDYKTKSQASLTAKLKEGEDHQLMFYGLLSDRPVSAANFVALELTREKTGEAEAPQYVDWQRALEQHIIENMSAIKRGAALPANGIETICQYCEVRGLCRKGAWS